MKIAVAGSGYVGLSLGVLLSLQNEVTIVDILPSKVALIAKQLIKKRNWSLLPHLQITTVELIILIHSMLKQLSKRY